MFPIMPGGGNSLSGGMGDLRANHFHAGLDIRTGGREGVAVHAAAEGYVSRIAVFTGGYGNVVFVKHPNGLTTVYGHLKVLNDTLGRYLKRAQYQKQTFEIDLQPAPGLFPVRQGEVIALSGNTGGSGGPHLHFEVRDASNNLINPLLFEFPELSDDVPPYFERIALRPLTAASRVNGEYSRNVYAPVRRADGRYGIAQPITASGLLGLELLAYDKANGSPYRNGLSCVEIRLDGRETFAYNMNAFPHEQTRYINVHMNYEVEQLTGQRFHRGYVADGDSLKLYRTDRYRGRLPLLDGQSHEVSITLFDTYQNKAELVFTVLPDLPPALPLMLTGPATEFPAATVTYDDNILRLAVRNLPAGPVPPAVLFAGTVRTEQPVSYVRNNQAVYLVNLSTVLPDSVRVGSGVIPTNLKKRIVPGRADVYADKDVRLEFGPQTVFDTLHLAVRKLPGPGGILEVNQRTIPLNDYLAITVRPQTSTIGDVVTTDSTGRVLWERTQMYLVGGNSRKYLGGRWKDGRISFQTRELGRFQLLTDVTPPRIQLLAKTPGMISAKISDDLSGINTFRAVVNEECVLMQYDYKRALIWSDKLDRDKLFQGEVRLEVTDRAGNIATVTASIK
ncbi:MAG: M23 family metallopeptidase [Bacteroidetes bacterium]|nr:M23 family metallopeptidase [Fibrella sp.]